jgi:uncharacterized membrane protein YcaP (DUF421 family)
MMDAIVRAVVVYLVLLVLFRIAGKRALSDATTFDVVLTLIISEALQQALIDDDNSMTNAFLLVTALVGLDILLSIVKQKSPRIAKIVEGTPVVLIEQDTTHASYMERERVDTNDIMHTARKDHGLQRLDQIAYAIVEPSGEISVVPKERKK